MNKQVLWSIIGCVKSAGECEDAWLDSEVDSLHDVWKEDINSVVLLHDFMVKLSCLPLVFRWAISDGGAGR